MFTIIYPYRDRDEERVKRSLDSLAQQTDRSFEVSFVDYGSKPDLAKNIEGLVQQYEFASYNYHAVEYQPWNKSRALNWVIRSLEGGYCFVADIDMIFHPEFVQTAIELQKPGQVVYFKTGFLTREETAKSRDFEDYEVDFYSNDQATGLSMFPVEALRAVGGFDEFYHFWGAEDTDVHIRLRNNSTKVTFYEERSLMLHQWHPSYRSKESDRLSSLLQVTGIVQINHRHMARAKEDKITQVNSGHWGFIQSKVQTLALQENERHATQFLAKKEVIDEFLFAQLPQLPDGVHSFEFVDDPYEKSLKYKTKKGLGKKVPSYYSLKEVNDKLLLHIISFYRNYPYIYRIRKDGSSILFSIIKEGEGPGKST